MIKLGSIAVKPVRVVCLLTESTQQRSIYIANSPFFNNRKERISAMLEQPSLMNNSQYLASAERLVLVFLTPVHFRAPLFSVASIVIN